MHRISTLISPKFEGKGKFYYKDDNIESIKKELNFNDVNSKKKEWVLICSKYKYKYFTNKDMDKLIEKFASLIEKDEEKENPAEK